MTHYGLNDCTNLSNIIDIMNSLTVAPFGTFHGRFRRDCIGFVPPYLQTHMSILDPHRKSHRERIVYGSVIMFFECRVLMEDAQRATLEELLLVEKLWPLQCRSQPNLEDHCEILYIYRSGPK